MWEVTPELQKKIHRLMYLKYRKHKKIANFSLACIFLYSILVFLVLTKFCTIEFEISEFSRICLIVFAVLLLIFFWMHCLDAATKVLMYTWYTGAGEKSLLSVKNIFAFSFVFWVAMVIFFILFYRESTLYLFLLFLCMSVCFLILCFLDKKEINRNNILLIYFIFYFIFLWPVLETSIDWIPFIAKIGKIIFSLSPFLLLLFRSSLTDFLWSGYLIRRWFKIKDSQVRNCPWCHWYIMKNPIRYCPHCGCDTWAMDTWSFVHICKNCGNFIKIKELDFPNFCPHCGLWFRYKSHWKR